MLVKLATNVRGGWPSVREEEPSKVPVPLSLHHSITPSNSTSPPSSTVVRHLLTSPSPFFLHSLRDVFFHLRSYRLNVAIMSFPIASFTPAKIQTYLSRIPLCSKGLLIAIGVFWVASISSSFQHWAQLAPDKVFPGGGM
jgi:hypothetical protein